jgi:hypothetical protein
MSLNTIYLIQGDAGPDIRFTINDANTGEPDDPETWDPIDLSPALTTASVKFRKRGETALLDTVAATIVGDGTEGKITVIPSAAVMAADTGIIDLEITIDFNGSPQTVQTPLRISLGTQFGS